jgi:AAA domain
MRIGISGAGATGKSTVMQMVAAELGIPMLPSVVRGVFARHGLNEKDQLNMLPSEAWELQREIFEARIAAEHATPNFISDRTLVDHMAYCLFRASGAIPDEASDSYMAIMHESLKTYDAVFFLSPIATITRKRDGFRQNGKAYEIAMDILMRGLYDYIQYYPHPVRSASAEDRVDEIIKLYARECRR